MWPGARRGVSSTDGPGTRKRRDPAAGVATSHRDAGGGTDALAAQARPDLAPRLAQAGDPRRVRGRDRCAGDRSRRPGRRARGVDRRRLAEARGRARRERGTLALARRVRGRGVKGRPGIEPPWLESWLVTDYRSSGVSARGGRRP